MNMSKPKNKKPKVRPKPYAVLSRAMAEGLQYALRSRLWKYKEPPKTPEEWEAREDEIINTILDCQFSYIHEVIDL